MNKETTKGNETLIKVSPAEIAKQQAGASTLTVEEAEKLAEIKEKQVELKAMEDKFKTDVATSRRFYKAQQAAFYGGNRKLIVQVVEYDEEGNAWIDYEGEILLTPSTAINPPCIQGMSTREAHLHLENRNCSFDLDNGIAVNFDVIMRIGKKEVVEYRKGKLEKAVKEFADEDTIKEFSGFVKSNRTVHKQKCIERADKLQELDKKPSELTVVSSEATEILDGFADKITAKKKNKK